MEINTARFGKINVEPNKTWNFASPILGFDESKQFVAIAEENGGFEFIQSLNDEHLTFILTDPFLFCPEYDFTLEKRWLDLLQIEREEQVIVRSIVTVRSPSDISMNLRAPIILNAETLIAAQVILEQSEYGPRYPIMSPKAGEEQHADFIEK
ncbi:flagellar assembly protein FliW [Paenibacillus sp. DYY-L-2]|uniref:flagellar assembly protein FliW n=1 Tax=Paenibacillus sp. DYY-L-2 TaxID=3447013 RepID=UPI003F50D1DD